LCRYVRLWYLLKHALSENQISDLSALAGLTNLNWLLLDGNQISDLSALAGLTNITYLYLSGNQISDLSALVRLTNLTYLYLDGNQIVDLSALAELTNLTWLKLGENQIVDVSALSGLTNLTRLFLSGNQIVDVSGLTGLTNLTWLYLGDNQISDLSALAGLTNLTKLDISGNQIYDLYALTRNIGSDDVVDVTNNPLNSTALCLQIPVLQDRGATVVFDGSCPEEPEGEGEAICESNVGASPHSADVNRDWVISLSELLRVIQFYNSDGYYCDASGEDGYQPGQGSSYCMYHSGDYAPSDWYINLGELLRVIQFFNTGRYSLCLEDSEDGYAPLSWSSDISVSQAFSADGVVTLTVDYTGSGRITAFGIMESLADEWWYSEWVEGSQPSIMPNFGDTGILSMAWVQVPAFPLTISYRVDAPRPADCMVLRGQVIYRTDGPECRARVVATPAKLE